MDATITVAPAVREVGDGDGNGISGRRVVLALAGGVGMAVVAGLITAFALVRVIPALSDPDWLATVIVSEVYACLIAGHLVAFGGVAGLRDKLGLNRTSWRFVGLAFVVWLAVWAAAPVVYLLLSPLLGPIDNAVAAIVQVGSLYGRLETAGPALFALAVFQPIVLTPLAEELIHRGSVFGWLRQKRGPVTTILVTSTLMAVLHPSIMLWPIVFLFGLGAGWVRERSGSLTPFLIMHMLNSVAMIAAAYVLTGWHAAY